MNNLATTASIEVIETAEIEEAREWLKAIVINVLNLDMDRTQMSSTANLFDLGIDSMSVVSLVIAIEEEFKVQLPEEMLGAHLFENLSTLLDTIVEAKGQAA